MTAATLLDTGKAVTAIGRFEFTPDWLVYAPVIAQWIWLGTRFGDLSLPTASNPLIETGGLCGESKSAILDQVEGPSRALLAPYVIIPADMPAVLAEAAMGDAGIGYPAILKPDIGCNGAGVRLIGDTTTLASTLPLYPSGVDLMLQRFVPWEGEAGLFYIRPPRAVCGRITSITLKSAPIVVGDGQATLRALILRDPRAGRLSRLYFPRLADRLDDVPHQNEAVRLVLVGNHCKGSLFADGTALLTPRLTAAVDALARSIPEFHFGRIDVRFRSLGALRRGEDFRVIEVNGAGSEATHIWDPRTTLRQAWTDQLRHYRAAWEAGRANRARGFKTSGLRPMYRAWRRQRRLIASYPVSD